MITGVSQSPSASLKDMLRSVQKEQEEMLGGVGAESLTAQTLEALPDRSAHASSSNVMSRNFASAEREESKYIKARQAGQEAVNQQLDRQKAILNIGLAELDALGEEGRKNYALRALIGRKTARRMLEEGQRAVREESERNLEEIKDTIEKKAQEATGQVDADGNPANGLPTGNTGEDAPMPETSASDPAPLPDASTAPAPEVSAGLPPDVAQVPALVEPAMPSIDITV